MGWDGVRWVVGGSRPASLRQSWRPATRSTGPGLSPPSPPAPAEFNARLLDNPRGFGVNRAKVFNSVENYSNVACGVARGVLQAVFFAPRGSPASFIRKEIAPKIDSIHEMFKLDVGIATWQGPH